MNMALERALVGRRVIVRAGGVPGKQGNAGPRGEGVTLADPGYRSSPDLSVMRDAFPDGTQVVEIVPFIGNSKNFGTAAGGVLTTTPVDPGYAFMPMLDGVARGPHIRTRAITGVADLKEELGSETLPYINPINGVTETFGPGYGESWVSGFAKRYNDVIFAGTGQRQKLFCFGAGQGGKTLQELKPGTYHNGNFVRGVQAGVALMGEMGCSAARVPFIVCALSDNDTVFGPDLRPDGTMTAQQWAARIVQLKRTLWDELELILPGQHPPLIVYASQRRFPSVLTDGRLPSITEGLAIAIASDPDILGWSEHAIQTEDTLHWTPEGNVNAGYSAAEIAVQARRGIGLPRPLMPARDSSGNPILNINSPYEIDLLIDTDGRELQITPYTVGEAALVDGGSGYGGDGVRRMAMLGGAPNTPAIFEATIAGGTVTAIRQILGGAYPAAVSGNHALIALTTGLVVRAQGSDYLHGARCWINGGSYAYQAEGVMSCDEAGRLLSVALVPGSLYTAYPVGPTTITPQQGGGEGGMVEFEGVAGAGATVLATSYQQFAHDNAKAFLVPSNGGILSSSGCVAGMTLEPSDGDLAAGAKHARFRVVVANGNGEATLMTIVRNGVYRNPPSLPLTATGPGGATAVIAPPIASFPVSAPDSQIGFRRQDGHYPLSDPAYVIEGKISSITVISMQGARNNGLRLRFADAIGADTRINHAIESYYGSKARGIITATPYGRPGRFGQDIAPQLMPFSVRVPAAYGGIDPAETPIVNNGEFHHWPVAGPVVFNSAGAIGPAGFRGVRGAGGATGIMEKVRGDRARWALLHQRTPGEASTAAMILSHVVKGDDLERIKRRLALPLFRAKCGAQWSDSDLMLSFGVYYSTTLDPLLSNGLPATSTALRLINEPLTPAMRMIRTTYTTSNQPVVPDEAQQLILRWLWNPTGVAAADDSITIELLRICVGPVVRPFVAQPLVVTQLRAA